MTSQTERLLDETGWRILDALQADARLSFGSPTVSIVLSSRRQAVRRLRGAR